ncbi:MAG: hypothetical protein OHK0032_01770 [Thermodesulfovibrionales bacterium]
MAKLTPRMKNWLEGLGAHIGTATKRGFPTTIVVESAKVEGDNTVKFQLSNAQVEQIKQNISENPQVAIGPAGLGCIRAAYQFKGIAKLEGNTLAVEVREIYCTKPGPEAALRLDTLPYENIIKFESTRWRDTGPPK